VADGLVTRVTHVRLIAPHALPFDAELKPRATADGLRFSVPLLKHRAVVVWDVEGTSTPLFQQLPSRERRNCVVWIHIAKREETREKRIGESIALLAAGKKLGLK